MRQYDIERATKEVKKRLEELGESKKIHTGDYYSSFWKKILDPIFNTFKGGDIHDYDRKGLGNAVIEKINREIRESKEMKNETKESAPILTEEQLKKIKTGADKSISEEIGDVSREKLLELTDGECGSRPKATTESVKFKDFKKGHMDNHEIPKKDFPNNQTELHFR
jgi:hypothetical protein